MTKDRDDDRELERDPMLASLSAEERELFESVQSIPAPKASSEARERARRAFVQGEGPVLSIVSESRAPAIARWAGALAAAAILVFLFIYGAAPTNEWRITDVVEATGVHLGDTEASMGSTFVGGSVSTDAGSELELQLGQDLRVRLLAGTKIDLPRGPGRWFGNRRDLELTSGEIYGTTGSKPLGWTLTLSGINGRAELTGTTFAIILEDGSTCFCLFEGGLQVNVLATDESMPLPVEQRITIEPNGQTRFDPLRPMERMKLQMLYDGGLLP